METIINATKAWVLKTITEYFDAEGHLVQRVTEYKYEERVDDDCGGRCSCNCNKEGAHEGD